MRVCIVADSASVRFGGEAILPYHYFRLLRQRGVEAWLVVHDRTRGELETLLPEEVDRIRFTPDLKLHRQLYHFSTFLPRRVAEATFGMASQLLTQSLQRKLIRQLVKDEKIDVVHQPTPVSPRLPSLMYGLGAPVVIGPLNGGMDYPAAFRGQESMASRVSVELARLLSNVVNLLLPGKRKAAIVLVANPRTRGALPAGLNGRVIELVENAVDMHTWLAVPETNAPEATGKQFLFMGRLVDWKRLDIAIRALAELPEGTLTVVGEGAMRDAWEALARELGVGSRVNFLGWRPQSECAKLLSQSVALLLPSVYECGGAVVLEAMASGRPVIATAWGGPADYLDQECGFLVEPTGEPAMVQKFAASMKLLLADPELAGRMGQAGRQRVVEHFDWLRKIDQIEEIYRQAVSTDHR
jgi:glycosyltransferase involved in cell wall biosynthesis